MRLRYQTLRFIAALSCGAVAMIAAWCIMWMISSLPIQDVIFISLFVYFIVGGAIGLLTESQRKPAEKPVQKPRQFCMYDMRRRVWNVRSK